MRPLPQALLVGQEHFLQLHANQHLVPVFVHQGVGKIEKNLTCVGDHLLLLGIDSAPILEDPEKETLKTLLQKNLLFLPPPQRRLLFLPLLLNPNGFDPNLLADYVAAFGNKGGHQQI
jgi:hypothetical protein